MAEMADWIGSANHYYRRYYTMEFGKKQIFVIIAAIVLFMAAFIGEWMLTHADAEGMTAWVICQPGDWVNVRTKASTRCDSLGRKEAGDMVVLDGKEKNGFAHVVNLALESDDGWIHTGYLVYGQVRELGGQAFTIKAKAKVQARKYVDGPRRCWLKPGTEVQVFYTGGGWSVTNRGFIKSEFLEVKKDD